MTNPPILPPRTVFLFAFAALGATATSAQTGDDFQMSSQWTAARPLGSGDLQIAGGRVSYTVGSRTESSSTLTWRPALGSYTQDWSVQIDVHMDAADSGLVTATDYLYANLSVLKGGDVYSVDAIDRLHLFSASMARKGNSGRPALGQRNFFNTTHKRLGQDFVETADVAGLTTDAALRIAFDSSTKILTAYYDVNGATGGYNWTSLSSIDVDAAASHWNMTATSTFVVMLSADSRAIVPAGAVTMDNFSSTGLVAASQQSIANISLRTTIPAGETLTIGFVIGGNQTRRVLVRAIGPGLAQFNVPGVHADPRLVLYSGGTSIGANDNWGGSAALSNAFASSGAFALLPTSADAAMMVTLPPGAYTAEVSGVGSAAGAALVEVYELP
jgi:hypothetical protein